MSNLLPISLQEDLYIGISGIELQFDQFELGEGIRLDKTNCVLLAPYMMVFESAKENVTDVARHRTKDKDGSTWIDVTRDTTVVGGHGEYAITGELYIPKTARVSLGQDSFFLAQWIISLFRMWSAPSLRAPVISQQSLSLNSMEEADSLKVIPFETRSSGISLESTEGISVTAERLSWVKDCWLSGAKLAIEHKEFRLAVEALDQLILSRTTH
jgi:hypothetical protein